MKHYLERTADVLHAQGSGPAGLSPSAAAERLAAHGPNALEESKKKTLLQRIWEQIRDPMVLVLVAAAIISGAFEEVADMVIILLVVVLNATLGIIQENKAEEAIAALQKLSAPYARVRRGGSVYDVPAAELVPGDVVLLEAGNAVPADLRILETASLRVEEAALTGESVPVEKTAEPLPANGEDDVPLGDRVNMAYMGTNVVYGRGEGVVIATGMQTEMGKIAGILSSTEEEKTPLQQKLASLGKVLSFLVLGICVFIFIISVLTEGGFEGAHVFEAFLTAVSLAVAAIPEGLVVVVTVVLSIGVTKMSKQNAIVRRLTAVETLGCTQVICSDKTGTLTQNKMTVTDSYGEEALLARAISLCTDVAVGPEGELLGDPTETALVEYARRLGLADLNKDYPRVGEAPFDSVRKMMSTVHRTPAGGIVQYTKGAPDEVLARCDKIYLNGAEQELTPNLRDEILAQNSNMAGRALRVLAAAYRTHDGVPARFSSEALEQDLTFIGLAGMIDPVRPEVCAAIRRCESAGIRAIMITGDHRDTAIAIARELGILTDECQAITGRELSALSDEEFEARLSDITVYARVQPEHKVRIVNAWKKKGKISAMTGDGVNDAPAIKAADIGVGMGITGTDVTKNVADVVLSDDNFATIVYAVEEGRRIYENIRKTIQYLLGANLSEVVSIFAATLAGLRLFAPIHILWINLVTDTFPAMALGMERAEKDAMHKPPRDPKETLFADSLGADVIYQGMLIAGLTLASFFLGRAVSHITGMTMAFVTLSMCEIFHAVNLRSRNNSIFAMGGRNVFVWGAMALSTLLTLGVVYVPGINTVFELVPLTLTNLAEALGIAFAVIPVVELIKAVRRSLLKKRR